MTNFEYWKDELQELVSKSEDSLIMVEDGVPKTCNCIFIDECKEKCDLYKHSQKDCFGGKLLVEWLLKEHIDRPKLTNKERAFCELVETGWIARDEDERLHLYDKKPSKSDRYDIWKIDNGHYSHINTCNIPIKFPFIKWEDEEAWSVEDLLKLEYKKETKEIKK